MYGHFIPTVRPATMRRVTTRTVPPGPGPLWRRLEGDLRERIGAGEFAAGFPGELALVAEYGLSRHTVRAALRSVREEGLVVSGRGRAPRVAPDGVLEQPLGALYSLFASVEAAGQRQDSVVLALEETTEPVAAGVLGLDAAEPLVHVARVRLADGDPLALDEVWLPADRTRALLDADLSHTALYDELRERCGVRLSGGREHIRAVVASPGQRRLLRTGRGPVALLRVERLGLVDGAPFEHRLTHVRSDRVALTAAFSPREGYQLG
jgi:GntR family transcriptional regulator